MTSAPTTEEQNLAKGLSIMAFAMMILPCMDAIAKFMATVQDMSPGQVTFYRFFFQMVLTLPLLLTVGGAHAFRVKRPWMNLLRGVLHAAATLLFFTAVKYMPLADVFAIYFVEPFMLTALSAMFLGEKVGWRRWLAIVIGFGGAMIVIQPSFAIFGVMSLLPVLCAFLFALYLFMNRAIGNDDSPVAMQTVSGLGGTLFMAVVLLIGNGFGQTDFAIALPDTWFSLGLLLILGGLSGYGHLLVLRPFPPRAGLHPGAIPVFRDHLGNRPRFYAVRRVSDAVQVARRGDHRRVRPLHHLAGAAGAAAGSRRPVAASSLRPWRPMAGLAGY